MLVGIMDAKPLSHADMRAMGLTMEEIEEAMICLNDYAARESDRVRVVREEQPKNATEAWISMVGGSKIPVGKKDIPKVAEKMPVIGGSKMQMDNQNIPGVAKQTFSIKKGNSFDAIDMEDSDEELPIRRKSLNNLNNQQCSSSFQQSKRKKRLSDSDEAPVDKGRTVKHSSSPFEQKRRKRLSDSDTDRPATPGNMKAEYQPSKLKKKWIYLGDSDDDGPATPGNPNHAYKSSSQKKKDVFSDDSDDKPIIRKNVLKPIPSSGGGASSSKSDGKKMMHSAMNKSKPTFLSSPSPTFTPTLALPSTGVTAAVDNADDPDDFMSRLHNALCTIEPAEPGQELTVAKFVSYANDEADSLSDDADKLPAYTRKCSTCGSGSHTRMKCSTEQQCSICMGDEPLKNMLWCGGAFDSLLSGDRLANRAVGTAPHFVCIDCAVGKQGGYNVMLEKGNTILERKHFIVNMEKKNPMIPCSYPTCNLYCDMKILLPKFTKKSEDGTKLREIIATMKGMVARKKMEDMMDANGLVHAATAANPITSTKNTPKSCADQIVAVHCPWGCGAAMDIDADGCGSLTCLVCKQHMCILCHVGVKCTAHMKAWGEAINSGAKDQLRMTNMCQRCNDTCHTHIKNCPLLLANEKGTFWPPDSAKKRIFHDFVKRNIRRVVREFDTIQQKMEFWKELQPEHKIGCLKDYFE